MPYMNSKLTVNMHFCFMAAEARIIKAALKREWVNGEVISSAILQSFIGDEYNPVGAALTLNVVLELNRIYL